MWLVELAPVTEPKGIVPAMIGALGLLDTRAVDRRTERTARDSTEYLFDVLADADCLLVVDNCEHLVEPVAELVDALLAGSPGLRVLATSREPLGIVGEALCLVPPLGLPPAGASAAGRGRITRRCACWSSGGGRSRPDSPWRTRTSTPSSRSSGGSTACRWPSSWPRRGCG